MSTRRKPRQVTSDPLPLMEANTDDVCSVMPTADCDLTKLSEESKILLSVLTDKLDTAVKEIVNKSRERDEKIEALANELSKVKQENILLRNRLDDVESLQRADSVILSGVNIPECKSGEDCAAIVCSTLEKFKLVINKNMITTAYRLGGVPKSQGPDKRKIMIKLSSIADKKHILDNFRTVKPDGLFANENLTRSRASILYSLRQAKKRMPGKVLSCGSTDGRVYVWLKAPDLNSRNVKIYVNDHEKLQEICTKVLEISSSDSSQ